MKHTDRYATVDCPACYGERGEMAESYAGYDSYYGPAIREEWIACETCEGQGKVQRVDRLAWLIGEARREDAALAPLTMPVVVREAVAA